MWKHKVKLNALSLLLLTFPFAASSQGQGSKLTPDQVERVHSRLARKGGAVGQIPEMLSRTTGDVHVRCVLGVAQKVEVVPPPSPVDELGMLAADSDLVVLGKTGTGTAHMTADKDFLYTDWNFAVKEVLKSNANSPVYPGATILVTRPGGELQVNGRKVYATCEDFLDFVAGQEYLLYLRFVPETGAYAISGGWGAFALSPTTKRLDPFNYPEWKTTDKDALLKTARDGVAISSKFPRNSGGGAIEPNHGPRRCRPPDNGQAARSFCARGLGVQAMGNSSGLLAGPTFGTMGAATGAPRFPSVRAASERSYSIGLSTQSCDLKEQFCSSSPIFL